MAAVAVLPLRWRLRGALCRQAHGTRHAATQARPRGLIGRSALRADCAAMLAPGSRRRTRYAHYVRCARTTAASQLTKRAARADPDAALLAALKRPRGRACAAAWGLGGRVDERGSPGHIALTGSSLAGNPVTRWNPAELRARVQHDRRRGSPHPTDGEAALTQAAHFDADHTRAARMVAPARCFIALPPPARSSSIAATPTSPAATSPWSPGVTSTGHWTRCWATPNGRTRHRIHPGLQGRPLERPAPARALTEGV